LRAKGKSLPLPGAEVQPPWRPFKDPASVWLNSACRPFGAADADMPGTFFAQQAVEFIRDHQSRPFFLIVSFHEPHSPFHFPVEYRDRHRPEDFKVPRVGPEDGWQIPKIFRHLTDPEKQGIAAAYYSSVEFLDKNIGTVLDALKKSGQAENTLVIYTGDHGYMLGQHGRFEKHCGYEPAVRSPLLVRHLGRIKPGQSTQALVELIDIFPTVLDYVGLPIPANVQGKSLVPVLSRKANRHRERVFIEYSENEEAYIRTDRWKFIYSTGKRAREDGYATDNPLPGRTIQLFDLKRDPDEMTNLARQQKYSKVVANFTAQLAEHLKRTARRPEWIPQTNDVHAGLEFCLSPRDVTETTQQK